MIAALGQLAVRQLVTKKAAQNAIGLDVTADLREVEQLVWKINQDVVPRARVAALNKTGMQIRTRGIRETAAATGVAPQMLIRQRYLMRRARLNRQEVLLGVLLRPVPAARLGSTKKKQVGAKQNAHGVTAGNRSYPHAWLMDPPNRGGGTQVFYRKGKSRYPIDVHKVDIAATVISINDRLVLTEGRAIFAKNALHELKWRLDRASR